MEWSAEERARAKSAADRTNQTPSHPCLRHFGGKTGLVPGPLKGRPRIEGAVMRNRLGAASGVDMISLTTPVAINQRPPLGLFPRNLKSIAPSSPWVNFVVV